MEKFITIVILLALSISGAQAVRMEYSDGHQKAVMDYTGSTMVDQHIEANPTLGTLNNHYYFYGSGSTYRQTYGYYGGYAKSGFSIIGYGGTYTGYEFSSSRNPYATVYESLSSVRAKEIYVYGYAQSSRSDVAQAYMDVYSPSYNAYLNNYWNKASGTSLSAKVQQTSGTAGAGSSSGKITTNVYANNYYDTSKVYAVQSYNPSLTYYPYSWTATAYASNYYGKTDAYQGFYGYGYPTYIKEYAKKYGWASISRGQYYYGTHALGQKAYTRPTSQGIQYPHWI